MRWHSEDIRNLYFLPNVMLLKISRRTKCVGMWRGWGADILWFVCGGEGKLEGTKHLELLGIYYKFEVRYI
jgi:hypothetical protein